VTEPPGAGSGFRIVETSTVAHAGFLGVDRCLVQGPDGDEFERYVVRHPGAVVVVPIDGADALLVRQWRVAAGRALLELPAGKRDVDGEAPEATAARELEEEIGCRPGRLTPLAEFYNSPGFTDEYTFVFLATALEQCEAAGTTAEERAMTVERVRLDDVDELIRRRDLTDAKSIVGLLLARRHLATQRGPGGV
jgi:ADP-ribose pyrophosphatase